MAGKALALISLTRPVNVLITFATVVIGGVLAAGDSALSSTHLYFAALTAGMIAAGGNAINDVFDVKIDTINRPNRPIPSGRLSISNAVTFSILQFVSGLWFAYRLSIQLGLIAFVVTVLLILYSYSWKRSLLLGNIAVAFCGALAFFYGAIAVNNPVAGLFPAIFAFLIHLAREVIKDVEDKTGDAESGAKTFPIVYGDRASQHLTASILWALIISTVVPVLLGIYDLYFLITVIVLVNLPLIVLSYFLLRRIEPMTQKITSRGLKLIMIGGLIALYIG